MSLRILVGFSLLFPASGFVCCNPFICISNLREREMYRYKKGQPIRPNKLAFLWLIMNIPD